MNNTAFSRLFLRLTLVDVKKHTTPEERKAAWVIRNDRERYEFHGPDGYYWHGKAYNAYEARANGWSNWLYSKGIESTGE